MPRRDATPGRPPEPSAPASLESALLPFFKALADGSRLRIVGLLATRAHTVEGLAAALGLRPSTVSHHLARLAEVGLVSARAEGYYSVYRLENAALARMATEVLSRTREAPPGEDVEGPAFDRKVLRAYLTTDGQVKALPTQQKKRLALLRHVARSFEANRRYTERQVNEILRRFSTEDYVTIRRYLIDHRLMDREGGGGAYWRIE